MIQLGALGERRLIISQTSLGRHSECRYGRYVSRRYVSPGKPVL